jgi:hypothetical protein
MALEKDHNPALDRWFSHLKSETKGQRDSFFSRATSNQREYLEKTTSFVKMKGTGCSVVGCQGAASKL